MELAFTFVYKITKLDKELDDIIINYLVRSKFNKLRNNLQSFYDNQEFYILLGNNTIKEVSYDCYFKLPTHMQIYDKLTIVSHDCIYYKFGMPNKIITFSLRDMIRMIYIAIYNNENVNSHIALYNISKNKYISRKELLKMEITLDIIKKNE